MALFITNGTYKIKNGGSRSDDKLYISADSTNKNIILVAKANAGKWVLRDQGFAGPEHQLVSLQRAVAGTTPSVNDLGFFFVDRPTDDTPVKYDRLASIMKLEESSDDLVTVRFTKGAVSLLLTAPSSSSDTQVKLNNRNPNDGGRQQWSFEAA